MTSLAESDNKQICRLRRDHYSRGDFTVMTDGYTVWLSEQKVGESPSQKFKCTRKMFNFLIAQYQKDRKPVRP